MRILVTGSRDWGDRLSVYRVLNDICGTYGLNYPPDEYGNTMPDPAKITVVHGDCPTGADHFADQWCLGNFLDPERHPAEWRRYGKRAGFLRNEEMARLGADLCIAFQKNNSKGTQHMIDLAEKYSIRTVISRA